MTNVSRHPKSGVYRFRRGIPLELRPYFGGKPEWIKTLDTKDATEAKRRARPLGVTVQELFDAARAKLLAGQMPTATDRAVSEKSPSNPPIPEDVFQPPPGMEFRSYFDVKEGRYRWIGTIPQPPEAAALGERAGFPSVSRSSPLSNDSIKFSEVLEHWSQEEPRTAQTLSEWRTAVRRFSDVCDDKALMRITKADIRNFVSTLQSLPARTTASVRQLSTIDQAKIGAGLPPTKRLRVASVQKQVAALASLFSLAIAKFDGIDGPNPFQNMKPVENRRDAKLRRPWTTEELISLFGSPVFKGCHSPKQRMRSGDHVIRDACFWLPLLGLFSGGRLEELGQLRVADVLQEQGIWVLDFVDTDDGESSDSGDLPRKRLKSASSLRKVPVHPELSKLGFLTYVEARRIAGDALLFPDLKLADGTKKLTSGWSKWFGRYRKKVLAITDPAVTFHSFRHGFRDRVRVATRSDEIRRQLLGHSAETVAETYGEGDSIETLYDVVRAIRYPGLDLSHLVPA